MAQMGVPEYGSSMTGQNSSQSGRIVKDAKGLKGSWARQADPHGKAAELKIGNIGQVGNWPDLEVLWKMGGGRIYQGELNEKVELTGDIVSRSTDKEDKMKNKWTDKGSGSRAARHR